MCIAKSKLKAREWLGQLAASSLKCSKAKLVYLQARENWWRLLYHTSPVLEVHVIFLARTKAPSIYCRRGTWTTQPAIMKYLRYKKFRLWVLLAIIIKSWCPGYPTTQSRRKHIRYDLNFLRVQLNGSAFIKFGCNLA